MVEAEFRAIYQGMQCDVQSNYFIIINLLLKTLYIMISLDTKEDRFFINEKFDSGVIITLYILSKY